MANGVPNGKLMCGGVGSILLAVAVLLLVVMGAGAEMFAGGGMAGGQLGFGMLVLFGLLVIAGGILQGIGFLGFKAMYGGRNTAAAIAAFLFPASLLVLIMLLISLTRSGIVFGTLFFMYMWAFSMLTPGQALLGNKSQTTGPAWAFLVGGLLLVVGGVALALVVTLGVARVSVPVSVAQIMAWVALIAGMVGHVVAGIAFFGSRS